MLYLKYTNLEFLIRLKNSKKEEKHILQPINTSSIKFYHIFNKYLWITQEFSKTDLLIKYVHDAWQIINIVVKRMTEEHYSSSELAILEFRNLINNNEVQMNTEESLKDIIPIIQKESEIYFRWKKLDILSIALLNTLYNNTYLHYSDIDHHFHIYVKDYRYDTADIEGRDRIQSDNFSCENIGRTAEDNTACQAYA